MLDELLNERRPDFLHESHQKEVIARFCSGLEHTVRNAKDAQEAKALVQASCRDFEGSCPSAIVRRFLTSYAEGLVRQHWSSRP